jgi:ceramide glucosyltransferase
MAIILTTVIIILICCVIAANAFYLLSFYAAAKFFLEKHPSQPGEPQPVSILIPLAGADLKAYESYTRFCRQDYAAPYQLIFGVCEATDTAVPVVRKLIADFPDCDIALVINSEVIGTNLKISNLRNMFERAKYEQLIIIDSDIRVRPDYLLSVLAPLGERQVGMVTCLYRAGEAPDFGALMEAVGLSEFMSGVLTARLLEGVKFALGSTMATTKSILQLAGGFESLKDYLADDFMLGNLIARAGYEVRVADYIVETAMPPVGFAGMMKHQIRWGRSTRISRPAGYLGLILTYGVPMALLVCLLTLFSVNSIILLVATLVIRLSTGWVIGVHWLGDEILKKNFWLLPLRDSLSLVIWCASLFGKRVEWRGRLFEVMRDGKMKRYGDEGERIKEVKG